MNDSTAFQTAKLSDYSFFAGDSCYHPEVVYPPKGVMGELPPYQMSRDNVVTGVLLGCFVIAAVSVAFSRDFILRHLRTFFYMPRSEADSTETNSEVRFQLILCLQTAVIYALVFYLYIRYKEGTPLPGDSELLPIGCFTGAIVAYMVLKWWFYLMVNATFFGKHEMLRWQQLRLFFTSSEGVLVFPVFVAQVYLDLPLFVTVNYALFIVILVKILTIYKSQTIFFKTKAGFVQNILYFCTLEMMPLGALWGVLNMVQHYLKVNF